jgi:hypothetical protein
MKEWSDHVKTRRWKLTVKKSESLKTSSMVSKSIMLFDKTTSQPTYLQKIGFDHDPILNGVFMMNSTKPPSGWEAILKG